MAIMWPTTGGIGQLLSEKNISQKLKTARETASALQELHNTVCKKGKRLPLPVRQRQTLLFPVYEVYFITETGRPALVFLIPYDVPMMSVITVVLYPRHTSVFTAHGR